jgi:hypothetical protein
VVHSPPSITNNFSILDTTNFEKGPGFIYQQSLTDLFFFQKSYSVFYYLLKLLGPPCLSQFYSSEKLAKTDENPMFG